MNHHTIYIHAFNYHGVLQRILLAFSRRRLRIQALQFFDLSPGQVAEIQIDLDCEDRTAQNLVKQLMKIVEVQNAWSHKTVSEDTVAA